MFLSTEENGCDWLNTWKNTENMSLTSDNMMGLEHTRIKPWCTEKEKHFLLFPAATNYPLLVYLYSAHFTWWCLLGDLPTELMKLHSTGPLEAMATSTFRIDLQHAVCLLSLYWGKWSICTTRRRSSRGVYTSGIWKWGTQSRGGNDYHEGRWLFLAPCRV